jgi:hypothetical protein
MEIRNKYFKLDEKSRREFVALLRNLDEYLSIEPIDEKIRAMRALIQKKLKEETKKSLRATRLDVSFMQQLRNLIVHNKLLDNKTLVSFGKVLWKEIAEAYVDDAPILYNLLSYVIQPEGSPSPETISSSDSIVQYFHRIYESKNDADKAIIIRELVPLLASRFRQRQDLRSHKGKRNENSLKKN